MDANKQGLRIVREDVLHKGFGTLKAVGYTLDGGGLQTNEIWDTGDAVAVFLYNPSRRRVLLLEQFRLPAALKGTPGGTLLEICAGKIEDLSPEQTARKEVMEETGYELGGLNAVMRLLISPGTFMERLHFYTATYDDSMKTGPGGGLDAESEHIRLRELSYEDARAALTSGRIEDAKTILMLQYALLQGLLD